MTHHLIRSPTLSTNGKNISNLSFSFLYRTVRPVQYLPSFPSPPPGAHYSVTTLYSGTTSLHSATVCYTSVLEFSAFLHVDYKCIRAPLGSFDANCTFWTINNFGA